MALPPDQPTKGTTMSAMHDPRFWDRAIAVLFFISIAMIIAGIVLQSMILLVFFVVCIVLLTYGSFIEPRLITLNKKSIQLKGMPSITIAVIGDIHVGPYKKERFVRTMVDAINDIEADMVLLVGDFIYNHTSNIYDLAPLKDLRAPLGVFAVLGNHDAGKYEHMRLLGPSIPYSLTDRSTDVAELLTTLGITMLRNTAVTIEKDTKKFNLAGLDDVWMHTADVDGTIKALTPELPTILMSHNPDIILDERHKYFYLIVSGHTHGGQIRLPLLGSLSPIPDKLGRKYDHGIFRLKSGTTLAITHGIGETLARARLFCPPEIMVLKIEGDEKT